MFLRMNLKWKTFIKFFLAFVKTIWRYIRMKIIYLNYLDYELWIQQKPPEVFCKKGALKTFANFRDSNTGNFWEQLFWKNLRTAASLNRLCQPFCLYQHCSNYYLINWHLTLNVPCISESCIEIKIKLNFYFHTSLWCLKRFYKAFIKPFETP